MYYVVVVLVLLVELHFVNLRTVRRSNRITLILREIPIPHLVERTRHERHRRSATVNLDIHQILPINFNLHAYSIRLKPRIVNIFRTLFFTFFGAWAWTFAQRISSQSRKIARKNQKNFLKKCLTTWARTCYNGAKTHTPPPPPQGGEGGLALTVPTYIQPSENIIDVLMRIVCDIIVDRLCDIIAGGTVVVVAIVRTVELLGRDGGEIGNVGLSINHRIHA